MSASKLRFYSRLQMAAHAVRKSSDRAVADATGLSTAQAAVMRIVADGDGVTQREVATALGLNESAITAMTGRLMKLGLVARGRSPGDPRAWILRITPDGTAALRSARGAFNRINNAIEDAFTKDELERFAADLDRLARAFRKP